MEIKTNIVLTLLNAAKAEGPWSQRLMEIKTNIVAKAAHSICLLFLELDVKRRDRLEDG